jgi:hypothetical protein
MGVLKNDDYKKRIDGFNIDRAKYVYDHLSG